MTPSGRVLMSSETIPQTPPRLEVERERLEKAITLIHQRSHDPRFGVVALADEMHISIRQLYRYFAGHASPAELIARRRIASAVALLLAEPNTSIAELARAAGFADPTTMRDNLHRYAGMGARQLRSAMRVCAPRLLRVTPETASPALRDAESAWVPIAPRSAPHGRR